MKTQYSKTVLLALLAALPLGMGCGSGNNNSSPAAAAGCAAGQVSTSAGCGAPCSLSTGYGYGNPYGNVSGTTSGLVNGQCLASNLTTVGTTGCPSSYSGYPMVAATVQGVPACCVTGMPQVMGSYCQVATYFAANCPAGSYLVNPNTCGH